MRAQDAAPPATAPATPGTQDTTAPKNDRILGLLPNYITVEDGKQLPPLTPEGKFALVAEGTFDPVEFGFVGLVAVTNYSGDESPTWGHGPKAFAKYYGSGFADQAIGNFMTGAVFPTAFNQDPRYYRLGKGSVPHRMAYALRALVVIRSDAGKPQPNVGEFAGNFGAAVISNLYAPKSERAWSSTRVTFGEQLGWDALAFQVKEWWPDFKHKLARKKQ